MSFQRTAVTAVAFGRSVLPRSRPPAAAAVGAILIGAVLATAAQAGSEIPDPRVVKAPAPAPAEAASGGAAQAAKPSEATKAADKSAPGKQDDAAAASKKAPEPQAAARSLATARSGDWTLCRNAAAEIGPQIAAPKHLLSAVTLTETGRRGPGGKSLIAWPWTINVGGKGYVFTTKAEAVRAVRRLLREGHRSIDIGCMQVNLKYHPRAFTSLEEGFDPAANLAYGASFLARLKQRHGTWNLAVQHYHSYTEEHRRKYAARFNTLWASERRRMAKAQAPRADGKWAAVANGARAQGAGFLARFSNLPRVLVSAALPEVDALRRLKPVASLIAFGVDLAALEQAGAQSERLALRPGETYPKIPETRTRSAALDSSLTVN